jgi:hypothetical protein
VSALTGSCLLISLRRPSSLSVLGKLSIPKEMMARLAHSARSVSDKHIVVGTFSAVSA